jgi:glucokinase
VGIGLPGLWHEEKKRILFSPNIPFLSNADIWEPLQKIFSKAAVHNDATLAAYGEWVFGKAKGMKDFVLLTLGTGIGGGIFLNGKIYTGSCGFAGEIGHMIINYNGYKCECGSTGCFEAEVSAKAITKRYFEKTGLILTPREIAQKARQGDKAAKETYETTGKLLGVGLASVVNIFDPEAVILMGGLSLAGDLLIKPAKEELRKRSYVYRNSQVKILISAIQDKAGVLGAAAYGWKEGFR